MASPTDELRPRLRTVLRDGERLHVATRATAAWGHDPIANATGRDEGYRPVPSGSGSAPRPGPVERLGAVLAAILVLPLFVEGLSASPNYGPLGRAWRRLWGGVTSHGEAGTTAHAVRLRLPPFGSASTLALTDQRVLLLAPTTSAGRPGRDGLGDGHVWDAPRDVLRGVAPAPRGPLRRRVRVTFTDGSWLALQVGEVEPLVADTAG